MLKSLDYCKQQEQLKVFKHGTTSLVKRNYIQKYLKLIPAIIFRILPVVSRNIKIAKFQEIAFGTIQEFYEESRRA